MGLVNNTTYSQPVQTAKFSPLKAMASAANKVSSILPNKKAFDTSSYSGIIDKVSGATNKVVSGAKTALGTITTDFGDSTKYESSHPGIDIANKIGTQIPANVEGTVTSVQTGYKQGDQGYGNSVVIEDRFGNKHRYSHLLNAYVMVGQPIKKGQIFASMGNSGQTYSLSGGTGSHLDYRIKDLYGRYINPTSYISQFTNNNG